MSIQINTNTSLSKAASNLSRESKLFSFAIHELTSSSNSNQSKDEVDYGLGDPPDQSSATEKSTSKMPNTIIAIMDKFEASISSKARMIRRSSLSLNDNLINSEIASRSVKKALLEMDQNSQLSLGAQANQTPKAVMKLLE
jgi:hypothetical protein